MPATSEGRLPGAKRDFVNQEGERVQSARALQQEIRQGLRDAGIPLGPPTIGVDLHTREQPAGPITTPWSSDPGEGFVYFIQQGDDGPVKIGTAKDPEARMQQLQVGSPDRLNLRHCFIGGRDTEREIHNFFREHHIWGEWFRCEGGVAEVLEGISQTWVK